MSLFILQKIDRHSNALEKKYVAIGRCHYDVQFCLKKMLAHNFTKKITRWHKQLHR